MKTYSIDFHDASVLHSRIDLLMMLKEHYPKLKVSLFWIPFDYRSENSLQGSIMRKTTLEAIKKQLDWIELIPHGLLHLPKEFEKCDYETMAKALLAIDEAMKKDDLPYQRGFCAPYWLWNEQVVKCLDDNGWWGAVDLNQPQMARTKAFYKYSHSIDSPFWLSKNEVIKLHGHIGRPDINNIEDCFLNLMKMSTDTEFKFVSEMVEK